MKALPYVIALVCAVGWYYAAHPGRAPWSSVLQRVGAAPTPREALQRQWAATGFDTTDLGRAWRVQGDSALAAPAALRLPAATRTYFAQAERPTAVGYAFALPAGRVLYVETAAALTSGRPYVELYERPGPTDTALAYRRTLPLGADTLAPEADRERHFVLRVEATPLSLGNVSVRLATGPSLGAYPVLGATDADVGSKWGAARDGGRRRHEGIDIFQPRGTPLVAAADGRITRVREGGLGGKTVWLRLDGAPVSLYYAHLDEQLTAPDARVRTGDTIGTVGNTGNARTTPPHLHFGIYGRGGAVDPFPFLAAAATPERTPSLGFPLADGARLSRRAGGGGLRLSAKQYARPLALADDRTLVALPDGRQLWLGRVGLEAPDRALRTERITAADSLRAQPVPGAPVIAVLAPGERVAVLAEGAAGARFARTEGGVVGWW